MPDWNLKNLVYGGVQNGFAALTNYSAGCTNVDTAGGCFVVWDCTITVGRFSATVFPTVSSMSMGLTNGAVIVAATPAVSVDTYFAPNKLVFDANYNIFNVDPTPIMYTPLSGEGVWRWQNPFPLAVIRPGFTLLLLYAATQATVSFSAVCEYAFFPE